MDAAPKWPSRINQGLIASVTKVSIAKINVGGISILGRNKKWGHPALHDNKLAQLGVAIDARCRKTQAWRRSQTSQQSRLRQQQELNTNNDRLLSCPWAG